MEGLLSGGHSLSLGPHRESDGWKDRVVVCCVGVHSLSLAV